MLSLMLFRAAVDNTAGLLSYTDCVSAQSNVLQNSAVEQVFVYMQNVATMHTAIFSLGEGQGSHHVLVTAKGYRLCEQLRIVQALRRQITALEAQKKELKGGMAKAKASCELKANENEALKAQIKVPHNTTTCIVHDVPCPV